VEISGFACLLLVVSTLGKNLLVSAGCSGKCCRGRDMSCSTTDWRMDRLFGTCYCDEGCVRTKDCCFDYFTECPGEGWMDGCTHPDYMAPVRDNLSRPCPRLEQRSGCSEYRDHRGKHCGHNSGIQTHLDSFTLESRTPHCTVENRPHTHWMRYITKGFKVCVACEPPAMRNNSGSCQGDGQESEKEAVLHWQAVGNHRCSGTWRKIQKTQQCNCPPQHSFVFI
uniref:SMB domain-containing protein n=1 Tax=Mola mola TaxID=94237 RepID=A0A3Q3VQG6_MOLML